MNPGESTGRIRLAYAWELFKSPLYSDFFHELMEKARRASPSSEFGRQTAEFTGGLDDVPLFEALLKRNYDAAVFFSPERAGHFVFQSAENGERRNVFYVEVEPSRRGQGLLHGFAREFLRDSQAKGVKRVQLGNGRHPAVLRVVEGLKRDEDGLGVRVDMDKYLVRV